jgi:hypothetical protein
VPFNNLCPLVTQVSYSTFETLIGLQMSVFFSTPPSPFPTINLSHVNAKTFDVSSNSDPLEILLKGKHKAFDIIVLEVDSTSPAKQGECSKLKKKK